MSKKNKVTTIDELKEYKKGQMVELPPFAEGQPFVARIKRASLMGMAKRGSIPNVLLTKANELFASDSAGYDPDDSGFLKEMSDMLYIIAGECLIEPTLKDIESVGLELTDEQQMFLFEYMQRGVKALENFRTVEENPDCADSGRTV